MAKEGNAVPTHTTTTTATSTENTGGKLLNFIEQPLVLCAIGLIGGIVATLFYTPVAIVIGACILVGVHRARLFSHLSRNKQIAIFVGLAALIGIAGYFLYGTVDSALQRVQADFAKTVAAYLRSQPPTKPTPVPLPQSPTELAKLHRDSDPDKLTLHDLYLLDFPSAEFDSDSGFTDRASGIHVEFSVVVEIENGVEFIKLYVPHTPDTVRICENFIGTDKRFFTYREAVGAANLWEVKTHDQVSSKAAKFSDRIFVYYEYYLSPQEIAALDTAYKSAGLTLIRRDFTYLAAKQTEAKLKLAQANSTK